MRGTPKNDRGNQGYSEQAQGRLNHYMCLKLLLMCCMVFMYTNKFGILDENAGAGGGKPKSKGGVLEGLKLFWEHNYVKGIFCASPPVGPCQG